MTEITSIKTDTSAPNDFKFRREIRFKSPEMIMQNSLTTSKQFFKTFLNVLI